MSADGSLTIEWAGEERRFRLAIGQLRELQEAVNKPRIAQGAPPVGPRQLTRAFLSGAEWVDDAREVIRLGLIGGGLSSNEAGRLVREHVDERPSLDHAQVASAILISALVGADGDDVGKKKAETPGQSQPIRG